ncbi:MAG: hypothetical protein RIR17_1233, partial [Planctomycetota bacterium]
MIMFGFDAKKYGATVEELLIPRRVAPLDPGRPN